jgi:hypothetical protein
MPTPWAGEQRDGRWMFFAGRAGSIVNIGGPVPSCPVASVCPLGHPLAGPAHRSVPAASARTALGQGAPTAPRCQAQTACRRSGPGRGRSTLHRLSQQTAGRRRQSGKRAGSTAKRSLPGSRWASTLGSCPAPATSTTISGPAAARWPSKAGARLVASRDNTRATESTRRGVGMAASGEGTRSVACPSSRTSGAEASAAGGTVGRRPARPALLLTRPGAGWAVLPSWPGDFVPRPGLSPTARASPR